jgi:hypothetical protein
VVSGKWSEKANGNGKGKGKGNSKGKGKGKMRGFFAALRMTGNGVADEGSNPTINAGLRPR